MFADSGFDGIVGLAYPSMAATHFNPLFDNIIHQDKLSSNVFSFYFSRNSGQANSQVKLGGWDDRHIDGPIHWHPVAEKYYWSLQGDNVLVNGQDIGLCNQGCRFIADTGTTLLTAPTTGIFQLLDKLKIDSSCKNFNQLPTVTYVIGGVNYDLDANDYVMKLDQNGEEVTHPPPIL